MNNKPSYAQHTLASSQQGSTLIAVLMILLMITVLGAIAIRQGLTTLSLSTNAQISTLLMRSSDNFFFKLADPSASQMTLNASVFGVVGFAAQTENKGREVIFCYQPLSDASAFNVNRAEVLSNELSGTKNRITAATSGFCDPASSDGYTSSRNAVMTQVAIKVTNTAGTPLANFIQGTDTPLVAPPIPFRVNTVSLLPSMAVGSTSNDDVKNCLKNYPSDAMVTNQTTVVDCLAQYNVPFNAQVAEYLEQAAPQ